jgi:superoxide dismutase
MLYKENPLIKGINQDKLILIKAELNTRNILIIKNQINACDNSIDLVQAEVFSHTYLLLYQLKRKLQLLLN